MTALLGQKPASRKQFPPSPPTSQERMRWIDLDGPDNDNISQIVNMSEKESDNPHSPYPGGPGNPDASPQQLKIMHDILAAKKMKSFCPDLGAGILETFNQYCWELARDIFIALVDVGEYIGLRPEEKTPEVVLLAIKGYAKDRLMQQ